MILLMDSVENCHCRNRVEGGAASFAQKLFYSIEAVKNSHLFKNERWESLSGEKQYIHHLWCCTVLWLANGLILSIRNIGSMTKMPMTKSAAEA
ncbi:hypothetical protein PTHTG4_15940 [Parageobacillus thermoglucosidasius]|nr:hypothetical protein PTHTG4_15940 [Parageobacillus thermoglucosidasius]